MSAVYRALLTVSVACLLAGCGGEPEGGKATPSRPVEIRIVAAHDGGSTALHVGYVLRVELPAQPDEGCYWEVASVDEQVLRVPVEEYEPPDVEGEPGTAVWRFEAIGPGSTRLRMRYLRIGTGAPTEERTFTFHVVVD